jgi:hypothetical protein
MMLYLEAPNDTAISHPIVFMAGGISGCRDWQSELRAMLGQCERGMLVNPRRASWVASEAERQIKWENKWLGIEPDYAREEDVRVQCGLVADRMRARGCNVPDYGWPSGIKHANIDNRRRYSGRCNPILIVSELVSLAYIIKKMLDE